VKSSADVLRRTFCAVQKTARLLDDEAERIVDSAQIKISRETIENMKTLAKSLRRNIRD